MRRITLLLAATLALLAGLFALFQRLSSTSPRVAHNSQYTSANGTVAARQHVGIDQRTRRFELRIKHGKLDSGESVIRLTEGDSVTLIVSSDTADELHVHGYNLHLQLRPNEPAGLSFVANLTGRFPYELHRANVELGVLEVYPR